MRTASAQTPPPVMPAPSPPASPPPALEYPLADTDRPLLRYAGMTALDISIDMPTYTTVDAMGNPTTGRTNLGHYHDGDFVLSHSFGPAEVSGHLVGNGNGPILIAEALMSTGSIPGAVDVSLELQDLPGNNYYYAESVGYIYKALVIPQRLALVANVGGFASEISFTPTVGMPNIGRYLVVNAGVGAGVQLTPRLELSFGASLDAPVSYPPNQNATTTFNLGSSLLLAFRRWDLYGQLALDDLTGARLPFAALGFVHRWGSLTSKDGR